MFPFPQRAGQASHTHTHTQATRNVAPKIFIDNRSQFSDELFKIPCKLNLLDCALWFKKMPEAMCPTEQDLRKLSECFPVIIQNPSIQQMNGSILAQWFSLFKKCDPGLDIIQTLLKQTAKLLENEDLESRQVTDSEKIIAKLEARQISTILYNLQKLSQSEATDNLLNVMLRHLKKVPLFSEQDEKTPSLDAQGIGNALYGLQNMHSSDVTEAVLSALVSRIKNVSSLDAQGIGNALYGLKNMSSSDATEAVLSVLASHIKKAPFFTEECLGNGLYKKVPFFTDQEIGNALYGLKNKSSSDATEAILSALASHIEKSERLSPQVIGNGLYGLQNMNPSPAVEAVLNILVKHIKGASRLTSQQIGNALYGLQNMHSSVGTEAVLNALASHIEKSETLSPQVIGNGLYGLQKMEPSPGVEAVLRALAKHIKGASRLTSQQIGNALYGLQNMSSSDATEAVLSALVSHIEKSETLSPQAIGNGLYGLQKMALSPAVEAVLSALVRHIKNSPTLTSRQIGNALYGLKNMHSSATTEAVIGAFLPHIKKDQVKFSEQEIMCSLYGLQNMDDSTLIDETLSAITKHFSDFEKGDVFPDTKTYLAEATFSQRKRWEAQSVRSMLDALAKKLGESIPTNYHPQSENYKKLLSRLLLTEKYISKNSDNSSKIDLHDLSHPLAEKLCEVALNRHLKDATIKTIRIVYGASTHKVKNSGEMRRQVEEALQNLSKPDGFAFTYEIDPKKPYVDVYK